MVSTLLIHIASHSLTLSHPILPPMYSIPFVVSHSLPLYPFHSHNILRTSILSYLLPSYPFHYHRILFTPLVSYSLPLKLFTPKLCHLLLLYPILANCILFFTYFILLRYIYLRFLTSCSFVYSFNLI